MAVINGQFAKKNTSQWELVDWHGNPELGLKCWRKEFGAACVYVGAGDFLEVSYSHTRHDNCICGTRWDYGSIISEADMMQAVDEQNGRHPTTMENWVREEYLKTPSGQYYAKSYERRNEWLKTCTPEVVEAIIKYDHLLPVAHRYIPS